MTRRTVDETTLSVRHAVSADDPLLRAFECSGGASYEAEVEAWLRIQALDLALGPRSFHTLWLVFEEDRLIAAFSWTQKVGTSPAEPGGRFVNFFAAMAIANSHKASRLADGRRLSDYIFQEALDRKPTGDVGLVQAQIHIDNVLSQDLARRNGLTSQRRYGANQVLAVGTFDVAPPT